MKSPGQEIAPAAETAAPAGTQPNASSSKPKTARAKPKPRKSARPVKPSKAPKRTGMSGLDAAAKVLADAGKPMRCAEIVERIFARRLWTSTGKTPAATLNAAMLREARDKGKASRFRKAGRGLFAATGRGR